MLSVLAPPASADDWAPFADDVLAKYKRATVFLRVTDASGSLVLGSGCMVDERGVVLTNAHVLGMPVSYSRPPQKIEVVIGGGEKGAQTVSAKFLGIDRGVDLAALRIEADDLPDPLSLYTTAELKAAQSVYVLGFPEGKKSGGSFKTNASSLESSRKENETIKEWQLSGGVNASNSGGPVADERGRLIGIAVAAPAPIDPAASANNPANPIAGAAAVSPPAALSLLIPASRVAQFLAGRLDNYSMDAAIRDGNKIKMLYRMQFNDPLGRVRKIRIEHFQGPWSTNRQNGPSPEPPESERTPAKIASVSYDRSGLASGEVEVLPLKQPTFGYWFRPRWVDGLGQDYAAPALGGMTAMPFERRALNIKFQPIGGPAAPMELLSNANFVVRQPNSPPEPFGLLMMAAIRPDYRPEKNICHLLLNYSRFRYTLRSNNATPPSELELRRFANNFVASSAIMDLKANGAMQKSTVNVGQVDTDFRTLITAMNEILVQSIDLLSAPIPNGEAQPLQTFAVQRNVLAGVPVAQVKAVADLKFTYHGTHEFAANTPSALFVFEGDIHAPRGNQIGGTIRGRVEISPNTGAILSASSDLKIDADVRIPLGNKRICGTMHTDFRRQAIAALMRPIVPRDTPGAPQDPEPDMPETPLAVELPPNQSTPVAAMPTEQPAATDPSPFAPREPEPQPNMPAALAGGDKRLAWTFKDQGKGLVSGTFKRNADGGWTMTNSKGVVSPFVEQERTTDYVLLVDPTGKRWLRCYNDRIDLRSSTGAWEVLYRGGWDPH
jgi:V8-like Glu-specific endopeptidase